MTAPKVSLAIIVPTADRAGLAIKACESILAQPDWAQHILVSNNSTDPAEVEPPRRLLRQRGSTRHTSPATGTAAHGDPLGLGAASGDGTD